MFNQTLKNYFQHLINVFALFFRFCITLKSFKVYLNYLLITLLKQYVIVFDFITITKKLKIILKLRFSRTFKNLKHYLNFIN